MEKSYNQLLIWLLIVKLSAYDIKERIIVFICRSGMNFYTVGLEHHGNKWVCLVFDSLQTTVPQKKKELLDRKGLL
jgi:hypothetical protein